MISANSNEIGKILYSNDEVEYLLGYKKSDLKGLNVSILLPRILRSYHDRFLMRYLESGKEKVLHRRRKNFAVNRAGYLVEAELMIKVYPRIDG